MSEPLSGEKEIHFREISWQTFITDVKRATALETLFSLLIYGLLQEKGLLPTADFFNQIIGPAFLATFPTAFFVRIIERR